MSKRIKIMAAALLVCSMLVCAFSFSAGAEDVRLGDVDSNGRVTSVDARLILRHAVRIESLADDLLTAADVDQNGRITSADARAALRIAVRLDDEIIITVTEESSEEPSSDVPTTDPTSNTTEPPATEPPVTEPPVTEPPATEPTAPVTTTEPSVVFLPDDSDPGSIDIGDLD